MTVNAQKSHVRKLLLDMMEIEAGREIGKASQRNSLSDQP